MLRDAQVQKYQTNLGVSSCIARLLFGILDRDQSGDITMDEFVDGIQRAQGSASPKQMMMLQYHLYKRTHTR